jgi:hypothetical protein
VPYSAVPSRGNVVEMTGAAVYAALRSHGRREVSAR